MNHFQTILPRVRMLLAGHLPSQARALLDSMLERELLSREYHCALLREPDGEALARKISLTLLEKGDPGLALLRWAWGTWQAPLAERDPDDKDRAGKSASSPLGSRWSKDLPSSLGGSHCEHPCPRMGRLTRTGAGASG